MTKDFVSKKHSDFRRKLPKTRKTAEKRKYKGPIGLLQYLKTQVVSRMFWGRSNFYKNVTQALMLFITIFIAVGGLANRIAVSATSNLDTGDSIIGSSDLLPQGGSIESVLVSSSRTIDSITHKVEPGETLGQIASKYKVSIDTIRWFNAELINPFSNDINVGWDLKIPAYEGQPINGVLYTVRQGEDINDVIRVTSIKNTEANLFNIVEFNDLPEPYTLKAGQKLFIPDGNRSDDDIKVVGIPMGVFIDPLSNHDCKGYHYSRGFTGYHDGVDLTKYPGCPVEAVAAGTVVYAGWENLSGNCVKIDHGGGIQTNYYHAEAVYVKVGQRVQQGQVIMKMGTTGNSTGTHLHITLLKDNYPVNPYPYIPY